MLEVMKPCTSVKVGVYITRAHRYNIDALSGYLERETFRVGG